MTPSRFDYIVVGAGSAGCVLANRLSADPHKSVLVLESGAADGGLFMTMPRGMARLMGPNKPHYWVYEASQGGNRPPEYWLKGRALGGSSSVNGMVYTRGMPADYDAWEALGCPGWNWRAIGESFLELEDHMLGPAQWRGVGGPLKVTIDRDRSALSEALIAAAAANGAPHLADINDAASQSTGGFGYQPSTITRGHRFSAANAFLAPVRSRPNLTVITGAQVLKILFDGHRANGVRARIKKEVRDFSGGEIILSSGAIESPKLLQLSGIGPARLLRSLGIEVLVDAPDVGRNLIEHRYFNIQYRVARGSTNGAHRGVGLVGSLINYFMRGRGALSRATFDMGGFIKTDPSLDRADAQVGLSLYTLGREAGKVNVTDWPGIGVGGYYSRPESRGEMYIKAPDADAPPYINANYFAVEADRRGTIGLARWIRKFARQPALAPYALEEASEPPAPLGDDDIIDWVLKSGSSGFHVSGTCRMGSDAAAVLDPELRVRGVDGLRVVDTSILPAMVSANTNGPAMAIALRAAKLILDPRAG